MRNKAVLFILLIGILSIVTPSVVGAAGLPDLAVTSVNAPTSAEPGGYITVYWTVKNQGNAASGSFYNRISLANAPYGTGIFLWGPPMDSIASGSSSSDVKDLKIPETVSPGYYYVTVFTDAFQDITESNENNNINKAPSQIQITSPDQPDLIVNDISVNPDPPVAGGSTTVGIRIKNNESTLKTRN